MTSTVAPAREQLYYPSGFAHINGG